MGEPDRANDKAVGVNAGVAGQPQVGATTDLGSQAAGLQSGEMNAAGATPEQRAAWAAAAKALRGLAPALYDALMTAPEPPALSEEQALLEAFDALPLETRRGILLGTPDEAGAEFLSQLKALMKRMLAETEVLRSQAEQAALKRKEKPPPKAGLAVIGGAAKMGQRTRKKQANLFFNKLFSVGKRKFYLEEPIPITVLDPETGEETTRSRTLGEWRDNKVLLERLRRVLKYSALPSTSRHHWGTDVDVGSTETAAWADGAKLGPMRKWLEGNRASLSLKTSYSGPRDGGYLEEPWHLTMDTVGEGLHERFNALVSNEQIVESVMEAFAVWRGKHPKLGDTETSKELRDALGELGVSAYVDEVHPDIRPEKTR